MAQFVPCHFSARSHAISAEALGCAGKAAAPRAAVLARSKKRRPTRCEFQQVSAKDNVCAFPVVAKEEWDGGAPETYFFECVWRGIRTLRWTDRIWFARQPLHRGKPCLELRFQC